MKNIYFFQVSDAFSSRTDQIYLPYAVGTLAAAAWADPETARYWELKKIIYRRDDPEVIAAELDNPAIAAFSNYVWNFEHNLQTARAIKNRFPDCLMVFGGHNVPPDGRLLEQYPFIDVLIFGEGEEVFRSLLLSQMHGESLKTVPNIAYRSDGTTVFSPKAPICGTDYPSPYAMGIFDDILKENPDTRFSAILETNRGCPYHCAFCDWGPMKSRVRQFPLSRVENDIRWFSEHRIDYIWGADGNFGLFERDRQIADMLVEAKKRTGYPQQIKVNYAKLNGDNVFYITKAFAENGLSKSTTMSLQSTSDEALKITGRRNISDEIFSRLISVYRHNRIPTYTELVLALPGETKESFFEGIGRIIASGQHSVIEVYDCIVLPNSTLAQPDYMKRYEVKTVRLPYIQQHTSSVNFAVTEYNETVIATFSMSEKDRADCRFLAVVVQCFHSMGLLRAMAIWCHLEKGTGYTQFYSGLARWLLNQETGSWNVFPDIYRKISLVNKGINEQYIYDPVFGDVYWPMDEGAYLTIIRHFDDFFSEIASYLNTLIALDETASEVLGYCKATVRVPSPAKQPVYFSFDFPEYFAGALENKPVPLKKRRTAVDTSQLSAFEIFSDYAREIIWFGRRSQKTNVIESDNAFLYPENTPHGS